MARPAGRSHIGRLRDQVVIVLAIVDTADPERVGQPRGSQWEHHDVDTRENPDEGLANIRAKLSARHLHGQTETRRVVRAPDGHRRASRRPWHRTMPYAESRFVLSACQPSWKRM